MALPLVFTPEELSEILNYIGIPHNLQHQRYSGDAVKDLHLLTRLHVHMISTVPYDNLWLHYSQSHINTIDPRETFVGIVKNARGRGGYCFQVSIFFNHVLRAVGFPAYLAPVRIRLRENGMPVGDYTGFRHLVNLVPLTDGTKWSLDVGFGGDGPTAPVRLVHDKRRHNLGPQEMRLFRDWIPAQLDRREETKMWIYQYRNSTDKPWHSYYAFFETEAVESDFYVSNWYTGAHPESFQTYTCILVKFLRRPKDGSGGQDAEQEIYGKRMLVNGVVKENLGGKTVVVEDCNTEEERLLALEKWFGMTFSDEEKQGIRGWNTELRGDGSEGVVARMAQEEEIWDFRRGLQWSRALKRAVQCYKE